MKTEILETLKNIPIGNSQGIAIMDSDRTIAVSKNYDTITKAISDEYCGSEVTIIDAEWMKHINEVKLNVHIVNEDNDEDDIREFYLVPTVIY